MILYYGSDISPNMERTPEGYLICKNVPINRIGTQVYSASELGLSGDGERPVTVYRLASDVFCESALRSFEGKDITRGHPPEMLCAENQAGYSKGHVENVRREGDNTLADLIIKDPALVSDVENGILREVSCGYNCTFLPYLDGFRQTDIIGNHVAVVPKGRAGRDVAIKDNAATEAEKGLKNMKKETKEALYRFFGLAANDAQPEELEQLTQDVAAVAGALDAEPAGETPAQEAKPAKEAADKTPENAEGDGGLGAKLDLIIEMLKPRRGEGERRLHDETDLDAAIGRLLGREEEAAAEDAACKTGAAEDTKGAASAGGAIAEGPIRDAAIELLRRVRPAVASIEDRAARARVTDALLLAISDKDSMSAIAAAATDSAKAQSAAAKMTNYEQLCQDSQEAYAMRNPHSKKEEK